MLEILCEIGRNECGANRGIYVFMLTPARTAEYPFHVGRTYNGIIILISFGDWSQPPNLPTHDFTIQYRTPFLRVNIYAEIPILCNTATSSTIIIGADRRSTTCSIGGIYPIGRPCAMRW